MMVFFLRPQHVLRTNRRYFFTQNDENVALIYDEGDVKINYYVLHRSLLPASTLAYGDERAKAKSHLYALLAPCFLPTTVFCLSLSRIEKIDEILLVFFSSLPDFADFPDLTCYVT